MTFKYDLFYVKNLVCYQCVNNFVVPTGKGLECLTSPWCTPFKYLPYAKSINISFSTVMKLGVGSRICSEILVREFYRNGHGKPGIVREFLASWRQLHIKWNVEISSVCIVNDNLRSSGICVNLLLLFSHQWWETFTRSNVVMRTTWVLRWTISFGKLGIVTVKYFFDGVGWQ